MSVTAIAQATPPDYLARIHAMAGLLEAGGEYGDRERRLSPEVVEALHEAGLFRLLLPRRLGGAALDLLAFTEIVEEVAKHDGSAAWCVNQASGISMGAGYLPQAAGMQVWGDPRGVAAWGPNPPARLRAVPGGYRVDYRGSFASGSPHATWLGGFCAVLEEDGSPRMKPDGRPQVLSFVVPKSAATIIPDWDVIGLRGTGSDSYTLEDVFVPAEFAWDRDGDAPGGDPFYRIRGSQVWAGGFASIALGLARAMLDAFIHLATDKVPRDETGVLRENGVVQHEVALCEAKLASARLYFRTAVADFQQGLQALPRASLEMRVAYRLAATHAIHSAKEVADMMYDAAGTHGIFNGGVFARRFRDIHTVTQQLNGRRAHYHNVGRFLLGLKPAMIGM